MQSNLNAILNPPDQTMIHDPRDIQQNKIWAALSYLNILYMLPLLINGGTSRYGKFHSNQGFILFVLEFVAVIAMCLLGWLFGLIPVVGPVISFIIKLVLLLVILAYTVFGIVNVLNGKAKELPLIGGTFHIFDK